MKTSSADLYGEVSQHLKLCIQVGKEREGGGYSQLSDWSNKHFYLKNMKEHTTQKQLVK
jgi:hypothetical protein